MKKFYRTTRKFFTSEWLAFILIGIGILARVKLYLENCSLCPDECYLAMEVAHLPFKEIFFYGMIIPTYPIHPRLFVLAVKLIVSIFGNYEFALRFIPFLSGVSSLVFQTGPS